MYKKPTTTLIDRPKLRETHGFKVRHREDIDQEEHQAQLAPQAPPEATIESIEPEPEMPTVDPEPEDAPPLLESAPDYEESEHYPSVAAAIIARQKKKLAAEMQPEPTEEEGDAFDLTPLDIEDDETAQPVSRASKILRRMRDKSI